MVIDINYVFRTRCSISKATIWAKTLTQYIILLMLQILLTSIILEIKWASRASTRELTLTKFPLQVKEYRLSVLLPLMITKLKIFPIAGKTINDLIQIHSLISQDSLKILILSLNKSLAFQSIC